jgi:hypothetical protein
LHRVLFPTKNPQQNAALRPYTPQARSPFWLQKPASEHGQVGVLPRLLWSWTLQPPTDTNRKLITSITAVLLLFVTCLLTIPRNNVKSYVVKMLQTLWGMCRSLRAFCCRKGRLSVSKREGISKAGWNHTPVLRSFIIFVLHQILLRLRSTCTEHVPSMGEIWNSYKNLVRQPGNNWKRET